MDTRHQSATRSSLDQVAETRHQIKELTTAWAERHRLKPDTPEYAAALETEQRLATRIWRRLRGEGPASRVSRGE